MKLNSVKHNPSFNGILISNGYKSPKQIEIMENIIENILEHSSERTLVGDLEKKNTDIFISANPNDNTVELQLLSHAGLYYNFIPYSNKGEKITYKIGSLLHDGSESKREVNRNNYRVNYFLQQAGSLDLKTDSNQSELKYYDAVTESDMMNNEISMSEIIPDARCILGTKQITTKNFVKKHYGIK